jgi:3-methyladenine DNA glycosylase/8-oxoguanine DNA glycosylase
LRQQPESNLIRDVQLDPQDLKEHAFDVDRLGLKVADEKQLQPRYRMRLWMVAEDNNVETGPGIGESKEKLVFLIVSENELLVEIAKEEESLHVKLEDAVNKLKDASAKLDQIKVELPILKANEFSPMARRTEEILETLARGSDISREVYMDYAKILRELQVNVVRSQIIERVERQICQPLNDALNQEFDRSDKSLRALLKSLEEQKKEAATVETAIKDMQDLISRLEGVLDAMGEMITLNKLIEQLIKLETEERAASEIFKSALQRMREDILNSVLEGTDKKPKEEKKPKDEKPKEEKKSKDEKQTKEEPKKP